MRPALLQSRRRGLPRRRIRLLFALAAAAVLIALSGCGTGASAGRFEIRVVAAENFWGSIAAQLAGEHATVTSVIVDPALDPHSYEPKSADARTFASAQLAIVNGVGYDNWASRLLSADSGGGRLTLNVGNLLGLREGDNPHRWYDPTDVERVANAIGADLVRLDPGHAPYYKQRLSAFHTTGLARYHALIAQIRRSYGRTPVGASESIFALLAPALGLDLVTPPSFMKAISEGTEVSAQDTLTTQRQITSHELKVWIYNSQNATPQIQRLGALAKAAHIPVATITETLSPAGASFQAWQVRQLEQIERALQRAIAR